MRSRIGWFLILALAVIAPAASAQLPEPDGGSFEKGSLPDHWMTGGPKCMEMPEWQVHEYNPRLFILRQSGCTDFEKPFLYLFIGQDKAMLLDTGSRNGNLAPTLQRVMHEWLRRNSKDRFPLLVVHTHGHEDHTAGDAGLLALHDPAIPITLIPADVAADTAFFHISKWPDGIGSVDLGGRVIDVVPIPGHSKTSIALYDRNTAILFPGDSLYPGRLYVQDFPAFQASTERMIRFTTGKPVAEILGNHIEERRTPYLDYPVGTMYQPDEHQLELSRGSLLELEDALQSLHGQPARLALRDFSIWPSGTPSERQAMEKIFEQTQKEQLSHMWDQPKQ